MSQSLRKLRYLIFLTATSFTALVNANPVYPLSKDIQALLNWAVYLSRYETPAVFPSVHFVSHEFMVTNACYGKECQVIGWYNDQDIIYIDEKLKTLNSLFSRSIVVHEMVHYLQHKSYEYGSSCGDTVKREAEAYEIQRRYFFAYGALAPIRQKVHSCDDSHHLGRSQNDRLFSGTDDF